MNLLSIFLTVIIATMIIPHLQAGQEVPFPDTPSFTPTCDQTFSDSFIEAMKIVEDTSLDRTSDGVDAQRAAIATLAQYGEAARPAIPLLMFRSFRDASYGHIDKKVIQALETIGFSVANARDAANIMGYATQPKFYHLLGRTLNFISSLLDSAALNDEAFLEFAHVVGPLLKNLILDPNLGNHTSKCHAILALSRLKSLAIDYAPFVIDQAKDDRFKGVTIAFLENLGPEAKPYLSWLDQIIDFSQESLDVSHALRAYGKIAGLDEGRARMLRVLKEHPKAEMRVQAVSSIGYSSDVEYYIDALFQALRDKGTPKFDISWHARSVLERLNVEIPPEFQRQKPVVQRPKAAQFSTSPRKFAKISIDELDSKIEKALAKLEGSMDDLWYVNTKVEEDLAKVRFGKEKTYTQPGTFDDEVPFNDDLELLGYNTTESGLTFLGAAVWSGEDGVPPVFYIVYWDGSSLRGYVPMRGNMWNTDTSFAYGYDREADLEHIKKTYPGNEDVDEIEYYDDLVGLQFDETKLLEDINARFKPR